jgi:hypothetical protein
LRRIELSASATKNLLKEKGLAWATFIRFSASFHMPAKRLVPLSWSWRLRNNNNNNNQNRGTTMPNDPLTETRVKPRTLGVEVKEQNSQVTVP